MKYILLLMSFCLSTSILADQSNSLDLKFALKLDMVRGGLSILEKFELVKNLGYDGIEVSSPGEDRLAIKAASDATGLPIHGVVCSTHWKLLLSDADPKVRKQGLEGVKKAILAAKFYGASTVLLVPGKVNKETTYQQAWQRSIPEIRKAALFAETHNIKIALENVWNDFLTTPEETLRFINEIASLNVYAYFDIGNTVRYNDPSSWPKILGEKILKLDVKAYKRQGEQMDPYKGVNSKIGTDHFDWSPLCRELKKISYRGWATAEVYSGYEGSNQERLENILADMKKVFSY